MSRFRSRISLRVAPIALLALLLPAGCGGGGPRRPNVLIVVTDTVRRDYLSAYGYPRPTSPYLEELAAEGVRFDRAYSTSSWTLPSHASLFTGVMPKTHRAHQGETHVADSLPLLAERLAASGYETAAFSNNVWVSTRSGLDRGFSHFENYIPKYRQHLLSLARDRAGELEPAEDHETVDRLEEWLEERDPDRPFFCFVNVVEPHLPYLPPWSAVQKFLARPEDRWSAIQRFYPQARGTGVLQRHYMQDEPLTSQEWEALQRMYEGELRVVDRVVERLVGAVEEHADPENTIVVVLSDHGENLGDHGHVTHIFNVYDSNVKIPMIARGPGFAPGTVDERLVSILDLYPTVLAACGLRPDPGAVGLDLLGEIPADRIVLASLEYPEISLGIFDKQVQADSRKSRLLDPFRTELRAAIGPRYKLILRGDGAEEIYDLSQDPHEMRSLKPEDVDPDELARLRRAVVEDIGTPAASGAASGDFDDPEARAQIEAMGYAGEE